MKFLVLFIFFHSLSSFAAWKPVLIARANLYGEGYQFPPNSLIANTSPQINNRGDILLKISALEGVGAPAIWLKHAQQKKGQVIFKANSGEYLSDPNFNVNAQTIFHHFDDVESFGLKLYRPDLDKVVISVSPTEAKGTKLFSFPQINDMGDVVFRSLNNDFSRSIILKDSNGLKEIIREDDKISYLFTPSFNNFGDVALKVRLGAGLGEEQPDQIRVYDRFGAFSVRNKDKASNNESKYLSFYNSVSLCNYRYLAYVAENSLGKHELLLSANNTDKIIATEGANDLSKIEHFSPSVNNHGEVIFRGIDSQGKRSVYIYSGHNIRKIISEGDSIPCDLAEDCYVLLKEGFPGLSGAPDLNDWGEAVVHLKLSDRSMKKVFGSGIYIFKY